MHTPLHKIGDFEVLRELGRGGMGIVYEARQVSLNRKVALKVLSGGLGLTGKAVTRFKREAEAAAKLHHTNIVPIYATGEEDDTHFYAMELIEGPSLDKVIKQMRREAEASGQLSVVSDQKTGELKRGGVGAPERNEKPRSEAPDASTLDEMAATAIDTAQSQIPARHSFSGGGANLKSEISDSSTSLGSGSGYFDTAARMIAEVADGLDYAHKQGVIHRDIKPSNVLLSTDGRLHINDFGLARMLEEPGMTISGEFLGSPSYMSPEQIAAGRLPLDHRTDIYSLGVVLYELLALQSPFTGQSRDQVLAQIVQKEPKPPRDLNKKIPLDLETICLKAIEKDPDRRYQTAGAMAEDLRRFVNRFAISARRASLHERSLKWIKRHPALASVGAVALIAILGASAFAIRAHRAAEKLKLTELRKAIDEATYMAMEANFANAERAIGRAELLGAPPGETRLLRGLLAYHRGMFSEAIVHLKEATNQIPSSPAAYALLVMTYADNSQWQHSEKLMPLVYNSQPKTSLDYLLVGQSMLFFDPQKALAYVDKGVELGAGAIARVIRVQILSSLAETTGNIEDARRATAEAEFVNNLLGGTNAWAMSVLASVRLNEAKFYEGKDETKRRKLLELIRAQIPALEIAPSVTFGARLNFFDYTDDEAAFERELKGLYARNPKAGAGYASVLFSQGASDKAYAILEEHSPEFPMRICVLADATGDIKKARDAYDRLGDSYGLFDSFYKPHQLLLLGFTQDGLEQIKATKDRFSFFFKYRDGWYEHLFNYYAGHIDSQTLLQRAGSSPFNLCQAHYGIGMIRLSEGNRIEAKRHFQKCVKTRAYPWAEYLLARVLLKRLERDPKWPPWIPTKE